MAHLALQTGTYAAADRLLGKRDSKRIGHNTILHRTGEDTIAVRYHFTDIVTMKRDGWVILRSGGYYTVTTAARMNALLPGKWRMSFSSYTGGLFHGGHRVTGYTDGVAVNEDRGGIVGYFPRYGEGGPIMSAADVAHAEAASQAAIDKRAARRTARLAAQHVGDVDIAEVRAVAERIAGAIEAGREPLAVDTERYAAMIASPHGRARAWDCPACTERSAVTREYARRILTAQHDQGKHVRSETIREYPLLPGSEFRHDYTAEPTVTVKVSPSCSWECPLRVR